MNLIFKAILGLTIVQGKYLLIQNSQLKRITVCNFAIFLEFGRAGARTTTNLLNYSNLDILIVGQKGTDPGFELGTLRFEERCLNHLATLTFLYPNII